jgi:hypothetical protein
MKAEEPKGWKRNGAGPEGAKASGRDKFSPGSALPEDSHPV